MSLPAWNRKAPSRAAIAATLSAFAVFGATSVAVADVSQNTQQGYPQQPAFGYGYQSQMPAPYGPGFGFGMQPASTFNAPVNAPVQGYAQPAPQMPPAGYGMAQQPAPQMPPAGYGMAQQPAPQLPPAGYGMQQPVPGFGAGFAAAPGFPAPGPMGAPMMGYNPYGGGFPDFSASSQWGNFAPSEPNYAPHERASAVAKAPAMAEPAAPAMAAVATTPAPVALPAPVQVASVPAAPAPAQPATMTTTMTSSDYSYEITPATGATYMGNSAQMGSAPASYADPYQSIVNQQAPAQESVQTYQVATPNYTQQYDAASSGQAAPATYQAAPAQYQQAAPAPAPVQRYEAPQAPQQTYAPAPNYTVAAPAPQQPAVNVGGYEYSAAPAPAPQQPAPDYYDMNASTAAAAAAAIATAPAGYETAYAAPQQMQMMPQQVAPRSGHFVQVGAFTNPRRAANLVGQLSEKGQQAFIVEAMVRGKRYHRVRVGAPSQRDARMIRDQIRELGFYEARVVKG